MAKKNKKKQQTGQQFLSPEQFMKQRARSLEIGTCYISEDMTECGEGHVIVTRRHTGGRISMAMFLLDTYCLGVKDSFFRLRLEEEELEEMLDSAPNLRECSYNEAHNWVYGAIAWAEEAGIEPDKSFAVTQYMLEEDNDDIPLIEYEFGRDGKHLLMAPAQNTRTTTPTIHRRSNSMARSGSTTSCRKRRTHYISPQS